MDKSDSIKELAAALSKAQGKIESAKKDVTNTFFKAKYADLASVVEAIRKPLADNGLSYVQMSHDSEHAASIETIIMHESGEWLSTGKTTVPVSKVDAQGFGSAMTYARRYSLSAAFGVAPEEDDGNAAAKAKPESSKTIQQSDFDKLSDERKKVVADQSIIIIDAYRNVNAESAFDLYETAKTLLTEIEEQNALWGQFASDIKTGIKAVGTKRKAKPAPTAADYAATP